MSQYPNYNPQQGYPNQIPPNGNPMPTGVGNMTFPNAPNNAAQGQGQGQGNNRNFDAAHLQQLANFHNQQRVLLAQQQLQAQVQQRPVPPQPGHSMQALRNASTVPPQVRDALIAQQRRNQQVELMRQQQQASQLPITSHQPQLHPQLAMQGSSRPRTPQPSLPLPQPQLSRPTTPQGGIPPNAFQQQVRPIQAGPSQLSQQTYHPSLQSTPPQQAIRPRQPSPPRPSLTDRRPSIPLSQAMNPAILPGIVKPPDISNSQSQPQSQPQPQLYRPARPPVPTSTGVANAEAAARRAQAEAAARRLRMVPAQQRKPSVPGPGPGSGSSQVYFTNTDRSRRDESPVVEVERNEGKVDQPAVAAEGRRRKEFDGLRGVMRNEVARLMYACGDVMEPDADSVDYMEDLTIEFLANLCRPLPPIRNGPQSIHVQPPLTPQIIRHRLSAQPNLRKYLDRFDLMSHMTTELAASKRIVNSTETHHDLVKTVGKEYLEIEDDGVRSGVGGVKRKGRPPKEPGERKKPGPPKGFKRKLVEAGDVAGVTGKKKVLVKRVKRESATPGVSR